MVLVIHFKTRSFSNNSVGDKREICIFVCWCIKTEEYEQ